MRGCQFQATRSSINYERTSIQTRISGCSDVRPAQSTHSRHQGLKHFSRFLFIFNFWGIPMFFSYFRFRSSLNVQIAFVFALNHACTFGTSQIPKLKNCISVHDFQGTSTINRDRAVKYLKKFQICIENQLSSTCKSSLMKRLLLTFTIFWAFPQFNCDCAVKSLK